MTSKMLYHSVASVLLASSLAANAAIIVPVDGNIHVSASSYYGGASSVPDVSLGAVYGQYASSALSPPSTIEGAPDGSGYATVNANIQAHAISLKAAAGGYSFGSGSGDSYTTLRFTLTDTDYWTFKFSTTGVAASNNVVTLSNAGGTLLSITAGCQETWTIVHSGPACNVDGATMQLAAGDYTLTLDYPLAGYFAGVGSGTAKVDLVTPVPVPAALPLFGGALAGLGLLRRRRAV